MIKISSDTYESSVLWDSALGNRNNDPHETYRERLRVAYFSMRERCALLAGTISESLRDLTVHDVSHSDALWETDYVITGPEIQFNALEAFVLGTSFLLHDVGMGLSAYPGGLEELKQHHLWAGLLRLAIRELTGNSPTDNEIKMPPAAAIARAQFTVLRLLHAEQAEKLIDTEWVGPDGEHFFLLEDRDLRTNLGHLIGKIAHSHWWNAEKVVSTFTIPSGPPPPFPSEWTIDPLKIALTLRLADAAHIDARRAPAFLRALRKPSRDSDLHWSFQEKLAKVRIDKNRLIYSGRPFDEADSGAWWLCADTLKMIDSELHKVDNILSDKNAVRFAAQGVLGVDDPTVLTKLIPANGWKPVDARVHIGDVPGLVHKLGGEELYGNSGITPLRELLQNAVDAIRARRILEKDSTLGKITVRAGKENGNSWIEVEDDGVGMSADTLTGAFLDFGKSFWSAQEAVIEFPALATANFSSIGRYGIGFFSVFMWGRRVLVTSRKYDRSYEDGNTLTFASGLETRPILRPASSDELLSRGGTRVRIFLDSVKNVNDPWMSVSYPTNMILPDQCDIRTACVGLCELLDVSVWYEAEGKTQQLIKATDWTKKSPAYLAKSSEHRLKGRLVEEFAKFIRPIKVGGRIVAKGAVVPIYAHGWVLVGGIKCNALTDFIGAFEGEPQKASRDKVKITVPSAELTKWANQQARQIEKYYDPIDQFRCSRVLAELGASTSNICVATLNGKFVTEREVSEWATNMNSIILIDEYSVDQVRVNLARGLWRKNIIVEAPPASVNNDFTNAPQVHLGNDRFGIPQGLTSRFNAGELVTRDDKAYRPVLLAIAEAWKTKAENLLVVRSREVNLSLKGTYLMEGIEVAVRNPTFCRHCESLSYSGSICCNRPLKDDLGFST